MSDPIPARPASCAATAAPDAAAAWAPLTEAQEGLWYAQRLDPANPIFNPAHCTTLRSPLDVPRFERAVNQALAEAESLSLRFEDRPDGPAQCIDPVRAPRLEIRDLRHLPETEAHAQADAWIRGDLRRPVDPLRDPLACQVLFLCGPALALWYQRVHHLAADGYGMALIEGRAIRLYRALGEGAAEREPPLAPLAPVWDEDRAWRADPKRAQAREFWLAHCAGHVPAASLAAASALSAHDCLRLEHEAPAALADALRALEAAAEVSWPDILTALGAAYVARHLGPSGCVSGVPAMGRLGSRSARAVATVMNVLPWVWTPDEDAPLAETVRDAARSLRGLRRHSRYRAEHLRRDLALPGGLPRLHGPILNVLPFDAPYAAAGLDAAQAVLCTGPVEDLTLGFRAAPDGGGLRIEIEANPKLYAPEQVRAHLRRLTAFLEAALAAPRLADVPTLTADEHERWALAPNRTAHPVPAGTLWSRIHERLRAEPGRVGLEDDAGSWTYADIDAWTARAARRLRALGAGPGVLAAVALPRSARRVLCLLAILRSGAAYLPLDPRQPAARLRGILDDARARVLIGPAALCAGLDTRPLAADALGAADEPDGPGAADAPADPGPAAGRDTGEGPAAGPEDPAYVIYTSGSTGAPKGVIVPHAAIVNRLEWMRAHYAIGPDDRILQKTPATFDVSVWELFLPFLSGACLVAAPPDAHRDPAWLCRLVRERRITVLHFVPSMLAAVLDEPAARGLQARLVFCSGEALPAALRDRFHRTIRAELHNLYGPTEAAVDVSYWPAGAQDDSQPIPIGWPVWNTRLHVLDERLRPVPPGTPGQLYLGGRQLATGYLGRPDLTAERFVPAPPGLPDDRLYATGDLATRREDGAVVYLGRLDHQVKLRGQRIELGEIEAVLAAHPDVAQATVLAREDRPGQTLLAAYVVPEAGRAFDRDALAAHMADRLPDYMVPAAWVPLAALPVTANGKLDRKALPVPERSGQGAARPPRTATERRVAEAFRAVLALPGLPGADDDFFALGGHSLLAARLALTLRDGHDLSLGTVFQYPTVARLATHLDDAAGRAAGAAQAGFGPVVTLREAAGRPALFCIHPAGGLSWCYGALARALPAPRTVHGLQAPALALDGQPPADSLAALARTYAERVLSLQAEGPYHLAGWSVGGILAQAVAVELQARGQAVGVVALLDAYPCEAWRERPEPAPEDLYKALLHIAGADPHALPPERLSRRGVVDFLRAQGHPLGALSDARLDAVFETVGHTNRLVRRHRHARYEGAALHFQAALDHADSGLDPRMWQPHVGTLIRHAVDSTHAGLPGAAATAVIAPLLDACLRTADQGAPVGATA
ncbi:amino acid adenylation domain-containing protein [Castellaniella defragrans]|uniref:amino acid adenylation domain-containing protein n=1 Tax=Castellaniella defragrans TaxID=75697 RepID=UPI002AFEADD1|nr:amino acid adenylation domain-containing protein [Castellaniella defragrans]